MTETLSPATVAPRPRVLSGIQPSGHLTLGNWLGALKNWVKLSAQGYDCYYMLVDLHAVTVRQDPRVLRERCYEFLALYLAAGLDPETNTLFVQSHVPQHAELAWVLNCQTGFGELSRMTQFKDKSAKHTDNINAGLFGYPVLMAADILLYQSGLVPVGDDQKQHLELTRDLAMRFNQGYGETFVVPEPMIPPSGARVMGLQDPTTKMSKSGDAETDAIYLLDEPAKIERKIKRAVTDLDGAIRFDRTAKPGVSNLLGILAACTGVSVETHEADFAGQGYGQLKSAVIAAVRAELDPIRARYAAIRADETALARVLARGAQRARATAAPTLALAYERLGFIPRA